MMGMGQQMPMRRPPMGPSPMTAGRPNPMAYTPQGNAVAHEASAMKQMMGGLMAGGAPASRVRWAQPPPSGYATGLGPECRAVAHKVSVQTSAAATAAARTPIAGRSRRVRRTSSRISSRCRGCSVAAVPRVFLYRLAQADAGRSRRPDAGQIDAMMHPFAPRNRPQFPGATAGAESCRRMARSAPRATRTLSAASNSGSW